MKPMIRTLLVRSLALMLFLAMACEEHDYYGEHWVQNDTDFVAQVGHIYHTEKNSFQVIRVDDSRCPSGAFCIWAGNATVRFSFIKVPVGDTTLNLFGTVRDHPRLFIDSLYFQLNDISPYRFVNINKMVNQLDYRIDMKVSRH